MPKKKGPLARISRWMSRRVWLLALPGLLTLGSAPPAAAGEILTTIRSRDLLRCGVSEGIPGLSERNAAGLWQGFDVDFCRAVAAAVLGDPDKVAFVPLTAAMRFPALQGGKIDLLVRNTSWTFTREAVLGLQFPAVLYYDGQAFMVPAGSGITRVSDLNGASVCVEKGTTHGRNLQEYARAQALVMTPMILDSARVVAEAFFAGHCQALTSDASQLAAVRLRAPGGPQAYRILDERISKEPLAPVVWAGDLQWTMLVRWVLFGLVMAEEYGAGRDNVEEVMAGGQTPLSRLSSEERKLVARNLGLTPGWVVRAIKAVGNYGEMFERNLGRDSPLGLERGLNRLWNQGGLMYPPPID